MILNITFSKPAKNLEEIFGRPYIKIRIRKNPLPSQNFYDAEFFTEKQAFQKKMSEEEVQEFYKTHAGKSFKNVVCTTQNEQITTLSNKHGKISTFTKNLNSEQKEFSNLKSANQNQNTKNYIIKEGIPVPFLEKLGVMNKDGKVLAAKFSKFRQINRFLEFLDDILDDVKILCVGKNANFTNERPLFIADFGCGKSYLSFAVYYFLTEIKHIPVKIKGLDLKQDVIQKCNKLALELGYKNLSFETGDVADANTKYKAPPDIMITLHACDTATDFALDYAVKNKAAAILSVPCCQHEINLQLEKKSLDEKNPFSSLTRYGIIQERLSALATDALRAELLEQSGYSVQILEFIDFEGTPKNLLIRAVKKQSANPEAIELSKTRMNSLLKELKVSQTLKNLLENAE